MFADENIAMLERHHRQKAKEEALKTAEKDVEKQEVAPLTLEEALQGIDAGELRLSDGKKLEFETRTYFQEEIPVTILKNFYQATEEKEESVFYVNHDHELSQIVSWLPENVNVTFKQWEQMLVNGMAVNHLFAKIVKREQLERVEYLCYEVPSKKGWVYNIIFRKKGKDERLCGNFNCLKEEADSYGVVLEAIVHKVDEWFRTQ